MRAHVVIDTNEHPRHICWTEEAARDAAKQVPGWGYVSVDVDPLTAPVRDYYQFRGYKQPDVSEAYRWLMSEAGELGAALNHLLSDGWVRNHPETLEEVPGEIGDVLMMLIVTAGELDIDPLDAMMDKWVTKGWPVWQKPE